MVIFYSYVSLPEGNGHRITKDEENTQQFEFSRQRKAKLIHFECFFLTLKWQTAKNISGILMNSQAPA